MTLGNPIICCKVHTEGERSMFASLRRKEVDEIRAIVACPQATCLKAQSMT